MRWLNTAQRIHDSFGAPVQLTFKQAHGNKGASHTKTGPGRFHRQGKKAKVA